MLLIQVRRNAWIAAKDRKVNTYSNVYIHSSIVLKNKTKQNIEIVQIPIDKRMDNLVTECSDNGILCSNKNEK